MHRITALVVLALAGTAAADPAHDAQQLNADGRALYGNKDYAGALAKFQRAYDIYPSAGLLLNIGTTYQQMGRAVDAANTYQRYLDDPGAQEPFATQTRQSLAILDTMAGRITVVVDDDPQGVAEVQIGDGAWQPIAHAHLVRVAPGTFVIRARLGGRSAEQTGRIGAGDDKQVELGLGAEAPPPTPKARVTGHSAPVVDDDATPAPRAHHGHRVLALATAGGGLVAIAIAIPLALHADTLYGDANHLCGGDPSCPVSDAIRARATDESNAAHLDRLGAIGLGVIGAAALGTGAFLYFHHGHDRDSATALTFVAAPHQLGLAFGGSF